ncbi:tRNA (guanine-N(7)-)-methyltransferase non-catalytic subunit wdr4-like isoform X1 [Clavelina lepadiformis]|uniref:tRNA (guanine-N(7)-)-methyltransferase non-catalytic subunit wdr4-like isoform X1 n=1 Tax=Clavelina lepadiformis TaxID=159417 RepID=UPI004041A847
MAFLQISSQWIVIGSKLGIDVFSKSNGKQLSHAHVFKSEQQGQEIDCAVFSHQHNYFAALFSDKTLHLWKVSEQWKELGVVDLKRRSTSLAFGPDEKMVYVADKSGDLYGFTLNDDGVFQEDEQDPVLGHISILLDIAVTPNLIITADRDEKIRISNRQHPYVIENFCLGHTEFVCRILLVGSEKLLSTSGDGTMRLWDSNTGSCIQTVEIFEMKNRNCDNVTVEKNMVPSLIAHCSTLGIVIVGCTGNGTNTLNMFQLHNSLTSPLKKVCNIPIDLTHALVDLAFDTKPDESSSVLNLLIKTESALEVQSFSCTETSCTKLENCNLPSSINAFLNKLDVNLDIRWNFYSQLYKATIPGHVYEVFYKKKEKNFKKEKNPSKKIKVDDTII